MTKLAHIEPTVDDMRDKILALEAVMLEMTDKHITIPLNHYVMPGIYMREIAIPAGATITGLIHKTEHYCILTRGKVSVWTEEGIVIIGAGSVVHSLPGTKRVMYAHEDSVWLNVHHNPTNEKDVEKMEEIYTVKTFKEFLAFQESTKELE